MRVLTTPEPATSPKCPEFYGNDSQGLVHIHKRFIFYIWKESWIPTLDLLAPAILEWLAKSRTALKRTSDYAKVFR